MISIPANREAVVQGLVTETRDPVLVSFAKEGTESKLQGALSISSIALHYFRNYVSARMEIDPSPVVLTGNNGAGKTNILEAISLLTPGRGLRKANLSDIGHQSGIAPWAFAATVRGMQGKVKIGTGLDPETADKRLIRIDEKTVRSHVELSKHLTVVWLTPQMEQLFQEGTSAGRRFLDRLVYGFDAGHAARINAYEDAMRDRNRLLKQGSGDAVWLSALEQSMAESASAIAQARLETVQRVNHAMAVSGLSFPKAMLQVSGLVEDLLKSGEPALKAEEAFMRMLMGGRNQDTVAGRTLAGPHRSALNVTHMDKQMPAEQCSTGEQKALLLSIILAQARAAAAWNGHIPTMLLDEVIAHLDTTRKLELFEEICQIGAQTWMTGTEAKIFADLHGKAQLFRVEEGRIIRQL